MAAWINSAWLHYNTEKRQKQNKKKKVQPQCVDINGCIITETWEQPALKIQTGCNDLARLYRATGPWRPQRLSSASANTLPAGKALWSIPNMSLVQSPVNGQWCFVVHRPHVMKLIIICYKLNVLTPNMQKKKKKVQIDKADPHLSIVNPHSLFCRPSIHPSCPYLLSVEVLLS